MKGIKTKDHKMWDASQEGENGPACVLMARSQEGGKGTIRTISKSQGQARGGGGGIKEKY